ncbi:hypothetical protein DFH06DRAFT_616112 [Mycena polygramma]|nr:hypothetical protein DFH06DRAFT_616112 [Mycena polygramma]
MSVFPQELIEAIVDELDDVPSLKSCCLAGSPFLTSSQRSLHCFLTVGLGSSLTAARCTFLEETPHIAAYIIRISIQLPINSATPEVRDVLRVLTVLTNVRICILRAALMRVHWERQISPYLSMCMTGFLLRQPLRELYVRTIDDIPLQVLVKFLHAAPAISFSDSSLSNDMWGTASFQPLPDASLAQPPVIKRLSFAHGCDNIVETLSRQQVTFDPTALRELQITLPRFTDDEVYGHTIICFAAHALESVTIALGGSTPPPIPGFTSPLPALRSLGLKFAIAAPDLRWIADTVSTFLSASAALTTLFISIHPLLASSDYPPFLDTELVVMRALEAELLTRPGVPRVIWRFEKSSRYDMMSDSFAALMRRAMPKLHKQKRLRFERYRQPSAV